MIIKYPIMISPQKKGNLLTVEIDGYRYLEELWYELDRLGVIDRLKAVPQLGNIPVTKALRKTRYDYVMLQMYLHQFVKRKLTDKLDYSYNNYLGKDDLGLVENIVLKCVVDGKEKEIKPSIGDSMQVLALVYNIGHYYNTFSASKAVISAMTKKDDLKKSVYALLADEDTELLDKLIKEHNYHHLHLINSLLILGKLDETKPSVLLAKTLLRLYLQSEECSSKVSYMFNTFKKIRSFSYFVYDLPVSKVPIFLDIRDASGVEIILRELLDQYNNKQSIDSLWTSVNKLLDDTVYNEKTRGIISYQVAMNIEHKMLQMEWNPELYYASIWEKESVLNDTYAQTGQFDRENILKLTFYPGDMMDSELLIARLSAMDFVKVGYYDRIGSGGKTILVSLKNSCKDISKKIYTSWRVFKIIVSEMSKSNYISADDDRYIAVVKFFLHYLLGEAPIQIIPTVDEKKCILVKRGKTARVLGVNKLLQGNIGTEDSRYEVEVLMELLRQENKNDVGVIIAGSILVFQKDKSGSKSQEYDGLIIFPNRDKEQILFVESKNRKKSGQAKKCLRDKLNLTPVVYSEEAFQPLDRNAYIKVSVSTPQNLSIETEEQ